MRRHQRRFTCTCILQALQAGRSRSRTVDALWPDGVEEVRHYLLLAYPLFIADDIWIFVGYLRHWSTLSPPVCLAVPHIHLFHASGILFTLLGSLMSSACMLVYPPTVKTPDALPYVSSASSILSHAKRAGCNAVFSVPVNIHEWAQSEEDVAFLRSLRFVVSLSSKATCSIKQTDHFRSSMEGRQSHGRLAAGFGSKVSSSSRSSVRQNGGFSPTSRLCPPQYPTDGCTFEPLLLFRSGGSTRRTGRTSFMF